MTQLPPDQIKKKKKKQGWFKRNILKKISRSKQKRGSVNEIEHDNVFVKKPAPQIAVQDPKQIRQVIPIEPPEMTLTSMAESISGKEGVLASLLEESTKAHDEFQNELGKLDDQEKL